MCRMKSPLVLLFLLIPAFAATFGTVVPVVGGASDIVLDEARGRLYLPNTNRNQVEVYSIAQNVSKRRTKKGESDSSTKERAVTSQSRASLMFIRASPAR